MKKDLFALLLIYSLFFVVILFAFSCNPLKPYKDVLKDSVNRSQAAKDLLAGPCNQVYPVKVVKGKDRIDTQYVSDLVFSNDCDSVINELELLKSVAKSGNTVNIDSIKRELLSHLKAPVINHYRVDTVPDLAAIEVSNKDRDKAIMMAANADKLTCEANDKVKQFEADKQSAWQCFKWFCSSLPYWIWVILTLIFGGSVVVKLLRSGIIKFL